MEHLRAYRAAADGKLPGNKFSRTAIIASARRLAFATVAFFLTVFLVSITSTTGYAQGTFTGLAGTWSGSGTVTLDDGSSERIRCRATYAVGAGGNGLNQSLTCASDAYKFNLASNVLSRGGELSGTWSEATRGVNGTLQGHGTNGNFQLVASAAGFNANISLRTTGNKQSVVIRADNQFRGANISLTR